jgi:hypothetical protein
VSGPAWSQVQDSGSAPANGIASKLGLKPTTPQNAAGIRTEPPVSLPSPATPIPVATHTPAPLEDPPAWRDGSCGFFTSPVHGFSPVPPSAISCMLVLANSNAPAARNRTTAADSAPTSGKAARVPARIGMPRTAYRSLIDTGTP